MSTSPSLTPEKRFHSVRKLLERSGPFAHPEFEANTELFPMIASHIRILVVGAGGLGCELLKNLALLGFRQIHVIDMDTIDLSNLNRQFLFRLEDVGKPKADVAAAFINSRIPDCQVVPHYNKIQDKDPDFYASFQIIVCGLDSIPARLWLNSMILSLLVYDDNDSSGKPQPSSIRPLIDGGSEGFKGSVRVVYPGLSACLECGVGLYPPSALNFPLCTLAHTPRLPEHCIEYARVILWPDKAPFGEETELDGDDPNHIKWIFDQACLRANEFGIHGVTRRLTQGVIKNIIPAVASTNAAVAALCATEALKCASAFCATLNNLLTFNVVSGVYSYVFEQSRLENCIACSGKPRPYNTTLSSKFREILDYLNTNDKIQFPGITTTLATGQQKTLWMPKIPALHSHCEPYAEQTLSELGFDAGSVLIVTAKERPLPLKIKLVLSNNEAKF